MTNSIAALSDKRVGFLGAGAMANALAGGLVASGVSAQQIRAADPDAASRERMEAAHGIETYAENARVLATSDILVVAVKPGLVARVLEDLATEADVLRPLWISIAAGVRIATFETALSVDARVVRAMPNTPALVSCGAAAVYGNANAGASDVAAAQALFESVGSCWIAPSEDLLDAVTGLSGSGPAYAFVFLEALRDAGTAQGLPRDAALELACHTVLGAVRLALDDGRDLSELIAQVSSPGGTTVAGLARLEAGGLRKAVDDAVAAATQRARELGEER